MPRKQTSTMVDKEKKEYLIVYWVNQNRYSILHESKLPNYNPLFPVVKEEIVGTSFDFKWTDGLIYNGEILDHGSKKDMLIQEERLEKEAVDRSFQVRGSSETVSFYALVKWEEDAKLSVLSSAKLNLESLNENENFIGQTLEGKWKRKWLKLLVLSTGTKEEMDLELTEMAASGCILKKYKSKNTDEEPAQVIASCHEDAGQELCKFDLEPNSDVVPYSLGLGEDLVLSADTAWSDRENELRAEIEVLKRKCVNQEGQIKRLRRMLKKCEKPIQDTTETVAIGGGITISREVDDFLKLAFADIPMKFLKELLIRGEIFTLEELASHSLKGGKSSHADVIPRPPLDPVKLKVAVDYTVSSLRLKEDPHKMAKFNVNLRDLCTNARKQMKKKQQ